MKTFIRHTAPALLAAAAIFLPQTVARAGHVYAGAIDTNGTPGLQAGDALSFVVNSGINIGQVVTGESQGVQGMSIVGVGAQAGLYMSNNITFTALSDGKNWTGAAYRAANAVAAMSGSFIQLQMINATGPTGGHFSFWDDATSTVAPAATFTIGTGLTSGTGIFDLTDASLIVGDGVTPNPTGVNGTTTAVDPYGHLHGRSWTADLDGIYTVDYVLHDLNGVQADSAVFRVTYAAPEPSRALLLGVGASALVMRRRRKS